MSSAYTQLSGYYNWIMEHVDYEDWSRYLQELWQKHGISPKSVLELAAGTCSFATQKPFEKFSEYVCSDLSLSMLNACPKEIKNSRPRVQCDAAQPPFKKEFDLCLMMYDSMNYFLEEKRLSSCFHSIYKILKKGGAFIFDTTTQFNSLTYFEDDVSVEKKEDITVIRESWYEPKNQFQYNEFTFFIKEKEHLFSRSQETHVQRIYSNEEMEALINSGPFTNWSRYSDFSFDIVGQNSERVHYILIK